MTAPQPTHPVRYRTYQFFMAIKASLPRWAGGRKNELSVEERMLVASILVTSEQKALFSRMSPNDQRHAVAVAKTLHIAGHTSAALLQAALLHDVAKSLGQPIPHRVLIVLFEAIWPGALRRLANLRAGQPVEKTGWWRRPFVIHQQHPALGAVWAETAACDPLAVQLIARHQDDLTTAHPDDINHLLEALQWADNLN